MPQIIVIIEAAAQFLLLLQQLIAAYQSTLAQSNPMQTPLTDLAGQCSAGFAKLKEFALALEAK